MPQVFKRVVAAAVALLTIGARVVNAETACPEGWCYAVPDVWIYNTSLTVNLTSGTPPYHIEIHSITMNPNGSMSHNILAEFDPPPPAPLVISWLINQTVGTSCHVHFDIGGDPRVTSQTRLVENSAGSNGGASTFSAVAGVQTSSPTPTNSSGGSSIPIGAIVGGVIGGVAVLAVSGFLVFWFILRPRRNKKRELWRRDSSVWHGGEAPVTKPPPTFESAGAQDRRLPQMAEVIQPFEAHKHQPHETQHTDALLVPPVSPRDHGGTSELGQSELGRYNSYRSATSQVTSTTMTTPPATATTVPQGYYMHGHGRTFSGDSVTSDFSSSGEQQYHNPQHSGPAQHSQSINAVADAVLQRLIGSHLRHTQAQPSPGATSSLPHTQSSGVFSEEFGHQAAGIDGGQTWRDAKRPVAQTAVGSWRVENPEENGQEDGKGDNMDLPPEYEPRRK